MAKLGLDAPTLRARPAPLTCLSISGFGHEGPWAGKPETDSVLQADTGIAALNREDDGTPKRMGMLVPDTVPSLYAVQDALKPGTNRCCSARGSGAHADCRDA